MGTASLHHLWPALSPSQGLLAGIWGRRALTRLGNQQLIRLWKSRTEGCSDTPGSRGLQPVSRSIMINTTAKFCSNALSSWRASATSGHNPSHHSAPCSGETPPNPHHHTSELQFPPWPWVQQENLGKRFSSPLQLLQAN